MAPLFSVVIPTFNRARQTAAAVGSVLAQTDPDFECFVIDDGSTDRAIEALMEFKDPRVRLTFNKENRGQHVCRNQAVRAARGEWICFLDSDDLFLPRRLEELRKAIGRSPETGFWFTNAYLYRWGRIVGRLFDPGRNIPEGEVPGYYAVGDSFLPYVTTTACVRRSAFERTGFFREDLRILEDTELYARMLKGGLKVGVIREPLAVRFLHEGQITREHLRDFEESMEALRSSGAPPEAAAGLRERVALEVAGYLWKSLRAREARELLLKELGPRARRTGLYYKTFAPAALLRWLGAVRRWAIKAWYHPAFAPAEFRAAAKEIEPFVKLFRS